jgi:probable rRNA maturation factor
MRAPVIDVSVVHTDWASDIARIGAFAKRAVRAALAAVALPVGVSAEICVVFAGDDFVKRLNREHRGENKPTNVLAFPPTAAAGDIAVAPRPLGDVVLAYETALGEAKAEGKSLAAHAAHLIVHGVLHLLGHDHVTAAGDRRMRALEVRILAGLGIADPYRAVAGPA